MSTNTVLKAIRERRTVTRFKPNEVGQDKIDAILEAARWAPSFVNSQPWSIIVVKEAEMKKKLKELSVTITGVGIEEAPVTFVVTVDPKKDPHHYVEDGAAATQNMALAAHSLGLASFWVGVFDVTGHRASSEERVKELLNIPAGHRVISMLPVGVASMTFTKERKPSSDFVYRDAFERKKRWIASNRPSAAMTKDEDQKAVK
jgi:nitroreductase